MTHILIQHSNAKFIQNCLSLSMPDYMIIDIVVGNNLYNTYFRHKPGHCLFSGGVLSSEVIQFCEDYSNETSIYIFHETEDSYVKSEALLGGGTNVRHIGYGVATFSMPDNLINDQLFYNTNQPHTQSGVVCFMDGVPEMPKPLMALLYPNTNTPIKLFNCPNIKHYQNLGMVNEKNRALLLQTHQYCLDMSPYQGYSYINEAIACGSIPISIDDIISGTYINKTPIMSNIPLLTYTNFLRDILQL